MNSQAINTRCENVNVEVISQILGANSKRFNPLWLLPKRIEGNRSIKPKYGKNHVQSTGWFANQFLWLPFSFYDPVNPVNSLAR